VSTVVVVYGPLVIFGLLANVWFFSVLRPLVRGINNDPHDSAKYWELLWEAHSGMPCETCGLVSRSGA
jgi:hypothetical protein